MIDERGGDLAAIFRRLIRDAGPISLSQFMGESNARYYATRDPLGSGGDFVTAPEVSQMFGELIGLWLADVWIRAGRQEPVLYVELGPGRGTLAKDALRACQRHGLTPRVHFIEASAALRSLQREGLPDATWHTDLATVPRDSPMLLVANEFLDALPVRQLVRTAEGWRERLVGLGDNDDFVFIAGRQPMDAAVPEDWREAEEGTVLETSPGAVAVVHEIAGRLAEQGGAALLIDYGSAELRSGSTLQAVRAHTKIDAFACPGEADLTAHVDFATLARVAQLRGARHLGTATQGHWLQALGIDMRAKSLATHAPHRAGEIFVARDRLVADEQMGELFKVMGLAAPGWPGGAGFEIDRAEG
ncbi:class I SAM-dependent methyltransferase [Pelagerythrobacter rhizovicinus]|uniref:Class I SAM-dependent methyltransferase n=1 Tax=Pelagerythrobacter rhizovicinus TaxID=2268576 RepID=A0A4Q2KIX8_9SPHN|nr:SAM-dependent methyltransferase [Pelagerythrobacter rhizovicinus]RXZ64299.1 class I SAM-dependent methyltransferase [Pelagerythrobacter rhizovicinus]